MYQYWGVFWTLGGIPLSNIVSPSWAIHFIFVQFGCRIDNFFADDAATSSAHSTASVIVECEKGETIWVEAAVDGVLFGSDFYRSSQFTGFYMGATAMAL